MHTEFAALRLIMLLERAALRSRGASEAVVETLFTKPSVTKKIEPPEDIWVVARNDFSEIRHWLFDEILTENDAKGHLDDEQRAGQPT